MLFAAVLAVILGFYLESAEAARLGPQIGYTRAKDADSGEFMYGLALRLNLMPAIGIEGAVNYREEDYADSRVTVASWPVTVTGLFYPVPVAYGAIGAGWYNTTYDYDDYLNELGLADETQQEFGWHFGGGVELPVAPNVRIAADIRYVFLDYDFEEIPGFGDQDSDFYTITVGVLFGY